jgi:hypothetical protein
MQSVGDRAVDRLAVRPAEVEDLDGEPVTATRRA